MMQRREGQGGGVSLHGIRGSAPSNTLGKPLDALKQGGGGSGLGRGEVVIRKGDPFSSSPRRSRRLKVSGLGRGVIPPLRRSCRLQVSGLGSGNIPPPPRPPQPPPRLGRGVITPPPPPRRPLQGSGLGRVVTPPVVRPLLKPLPLQNSKLGKVVVPPAPPPPPSPLQVSGLGRVAVPSPPLLRCFRHRDASLEQIPSFIGKLTHLELLDLKQSLVTELPPEVEGLKRIRHILIYHHQKDPLTDSYDLIGFKASCSVGGFKFLEKLCFVESDISLLKDLGYLTKLRRLGITKLRAEHGKMLCSSLEKLGMLESLNIHALEEDEIIALHDLSPPPKILKRIYLHGRLEELPKWISSCQYLRKVILRWSQLEEDLLATLGELPELAELQLCRAYNGKQMDFKNRHFLKLKILLLDELEPLRSMSLEQGTLPNLESLTISRCQWLEEIPSGIEHIRAEKLTFFDMSHKFYEKVKADHETDDYRIFKHIPEVYFTRWRAGCWETHPFSERF